MANFELMRELNRKNTTKIVLLVLDGLGGLPLESGGPTELEAANSTHLDRLARDSALGQIIPILRGITPGSGPAHLSLFGYDPLSYAVGRGVLEASGIGMPLQEGDILARGNFCTIDAEGKIIDRRAGRIPTDQALPIAEKLQNITLPGVETEVRVVKEHRFAIALRGEGLSPNIEDTDPQQTGVPPLPALAKDAESQHAADLINQWLQKALDILSDEPKANCVTLRGFSTDPKLPKYADIYGLKAACIAVYPMYRGVSSLVGMQVLDVHGDMPEDEFAVLKENWDAYDFFFVHIKKTDSTGEDGNFQGKSSYIELVDQAMPLLMELNPDVLAITGDHSTPAKMAMHSWHPVPFLLWAPKFGRPDDQVVFGETACAKGGLGTFMATDIMPLLLAHAGRLEKFGA